MNTKIVKVLLAKLGLDVHNRGIITVAKALRDSQMEVVYIGNALPEEIIKTAIQEYVDVIGVSSLAGAHLTLGKELIDEAKKENIFEDTILLIGGVFSPDDGNNLARLGFDAVFTPGTTRNEIVTAILTNLKEKQA